MQAAMGQLSLYTDTPKSERCYAILIYGNKIGFYQYYKPVHYPLIHYNKNILNPKYSYIVHNNAFINGCVPMLSSILDHRDVLVNYKNHEYLQQAMSNIPYDRPESNIVIPQFITWDLNDYRHILHIHDTFNQMKNKDLPGLGISEYEAIKEEYDPYSPFHQPQPVTTFLVLINLFKNINHSFHLSRFLN